MTMRNISVKSAKEFAALKRRVHECTLCEAALPHPPNPVFSAPEGAKIVIIGQAPGIVAHDSSKPWNDKSGDRLRQWTGISDHTFYDSGYVALIPMGFCFPGYKNGADAPPRKECAPTWHAALLSHLSPSLTILVGRYAQQFYLPEYNTLTAAVSSNSERQDELLVLPHPSGRNNRWLGRNRWFTETTLPLVKRRVCAALPQNRI